MISRYLQMWSMSEYRYWRCCIQFPTTGPEIDGLNDMIDEHVDVSRRTFMKHVGREELMDMAENLGYSSHPRKGHGLTMAADWSISYHRSKYRGHRVYYFRWSAIEYIYVPSKHIGGYHA